MSDMQDMDIGIGINLDTKEFSKSVSACRNILDGFMKDISKSGMKLNSTVNKKIRSLVSSFNVAGYGADAGSINTYNKKTGKLSKAGKKPENLYFERVVGVQNRAYYQLGTTIAKINTAIEPLVANMEMVRTLSNRTNAEFLKTENYQNIINEKTKNSLNASIAKKKAELENIDLKKEEKNLQEQINKELKGAEDSTQRQTKNQVSLVTQLRRMFTSVYVIKRFANIFRDMTKESGAWIENLNLFAVSFGEDFYRESLDWATSFSEKLGVSSNEIIKLTANFRQLTSAIGYTQELSDALSKTLTSLSYDLTSYYNLESADTAYTKLSSGIFSGQVKTLRSLGIDVSAESVTTYLKELSGTYSEFIGITNAGLDQSQKVLARTLLVMKSATNSFGDMARSIETLANRERIFQASIQNLKLALGDLMSDGLSNLLAYLNGTIRAITTIIRVFKPLKEELPYEIGGTVLGQVSEEAEEAEKSISKLSFDKFETLTGGSDSKGQLGITEALTAELQKQIALYEEQASKFDGIDETAQRVYNSLLKWAFPLSEINKETGEITLNTEKYGDGLQAIVDLSNTLTNVWNTFKPILPALIEVSGAILDIVGNIVTLLDKLGLLEEVIYAIIAMDLLFKLASIVTAVTTLIPLIASLGSIIATVFANPASWLIVLVGLLIAFKDQIKWIVQEIGKFIVNVFVGVISIMTDTVIGFWNGVVRLFEDIFNIFNELVDAIFGIFGGSFDFRFDFSSAKINGSAWDTLMVPQFYNGGSLDMGTQIWGMNEQGNPEFMFNAGGYDSVINADILEKAIAKGTESAIISSGLLESSNKELVVRGDRIDNDALARAIFPALQKESRRLGGNKL